MPPSPPYILGIDEAGRGPALGPMTYSCAFCPKDSLPSLLALKADDSKALTPAARAALREALLSAPFLSTHTITLSAAEISAAMLRPVKHNLNSLSHDAALALVAHALASGANITEIYVDTVGRPDAYAAKFRDAFPGLSKIVVEAKADGTYPIVGAASIVAKTERDAAVEGWVFPEEGAGVHFPRDYGSGYPSDPKTKAWMRANLDDVFGFPHFARFSWGPAKALLEERAVKVEWQCDEEEEGDDAQVATGSSNISSFFGAGAAVAPKAKTPVPKRKAQAPEPVFFKRRCIRPVDFNSL